MKVLTFIVAVMMMNGCNGQNTSAPVVRPATQANRFYTGDAQELREEVDSFLTLHKGCDTFDDVAAVIVPHAGYYFSGNVAASAYMSIPTDKPFKRIFLLGPSHHEWLDGASVNTEADYYATPLGNVRVDRETAVALTQKDSVFSYRKEAHDREHCIEVQLPFLQRLFAIHSTSAKEVPPIVPVIISTNDFSKLKRMAEVLNPYFTDENLFVVSSDFSHYPSYEDACEVDARTGKAVETGDVEQFIAAIEENARLGKRNLATSACGEFAIVTLMCMLDKSPGQYEVRHLMYQNSGDIDNHDHCRVVGYHSFVILRSGQQRTDIGSGQQRSDIGSGQQRSDIGSGQQRSDIGSGQQQRTVTGFTLSDEDKKVLKDIALQSIRDSLDGKPIATFPSPTSALKAKCGAFVSLHKHGQLRGCIGHFGEDVQLQEVVADMARAAAFEDPRFLPVRREELDDIDIEISVLTPMRRIQGLDEFELHRHGIYIRKGHRSGTFLPQVADEVDWTKEEFVGHCSRDKAGLGWDGWKDAELYVYEAIVF